MKDGVWVLNSYFHCPGTGSTNHVTECCQTSFMVVFTDWDNKGYIMLYHHLLNSWITLTVFQGGQRTSSMKVVIDMGSITVSLARVLPPFLA